VSIRPRPIATLTTSVPSTELECVLLTLDQEPSAVVTELDSLWSLIRFLSLRLKPKAAARPRMGRGPGTLATGDTDDNDDELMLSFGPENDVAVRLADP
jgi:hypothetical protein